jgi:hypothetical protein
MAATDIVRCGDELLPESSRQQTGRAQAQEAFTKRYSQYDYAKEYAHRAYEASPVRPAYMASDYARHSTLRSDVHNVFPPALVRHARCARDATRHGLGRESLGVRDIRMERNYHMIGLHDLTQWHFHIFAYGCGERLPGLGIEHPRLWADPSDAYLSPTTPECAMRRTAHSPQTV